MTEKNSKNRKSRLDDILDQFSASEKDRVKEIWGKSGRLDPFAEISNEETDRALASVHSRIVTEKKPATKNSRKSVSPGHLRIWLSAAVILIVFAAGWLLIPKTASVPYGEMALLELPDGSTVEMNSGTTVRYSRLFSYTGRSLELHGEAYFNVKKSKHPFQVETNGMIVEVTGTSFNIRSWSDDPLGETKVAVTEGEVRFYRLDAADKKIILRPGEMSIWHNGLTEPAPPEPVSAGDVAVWREQRFVFQEKSLLSIFNELERRYNVQIDLDAESYSFETLTAYYNQPRNLESILEDICMVKGLRYSKTANGYRIFK